eukprot:gene16414-22382_t
MNFEVLERAINLNLCLPCLILFVDPKNEDILLEKENIIIDCIITKLTNNTTDVNTLMKTLLKGGSGNYNCPCCLGYLTLKQMDKLCHDLKRSIEPLELSQYSTTGIQRSLAIELIIPPVFDALRLTTRNVIMSSTQKLFPFPSINELLTRLLRKKMKILFGITLVDTNLSDAKENHKKRKIVDIDSSQDQFDTNNFEINRENADMLITAYKTLSKDGITQLYKNLKSFMSDNMNEPIAYSMKTQTNSIYLFGRYLKYARDVPQSPWTLATANDIASTRINQNNNNNNNNEEVAIINKEDDDYEGVSQEQRKGRNSIEEIISFSTKKILKVDSCKFHPCGREDIDVRCLGNGRPFVMEIHNAKVFPSIEYLNMIVSEINNKNDLNISGDIELVTLVNTTKATWDIMQEKAEEKKKGYSCVVWSSIPINKNVLKSIEMMSNNNKDDEGEDCLEIMQKTPLRVMHRRSLLTRKRYVYNIETILLNSHFFILKLVTSAGTYVKEFVHGDFNRTFPSVKSILNAQ